MLDDLRLRAFGTRLNGRLIDEVKTRAAVRRMSVQDITAEALQMWLASDARRNAEEHTIAVGSPGTTNE